MTKKPTQKQRLLDDAALRAVRGGRVPEAAAETPAGPDASQASRDANLFSYLDPKFFRRDLLRLQITALPRGV
jgi:hypothetical protein